MPDRDYTEAEKLAREAFSNPLGLSLPEERLLARAFLKLRAEQIAQDCSSGGFLHRGFNGCPKCDPRPFADGGSLRED